MDKKIFDRFVNACDFKNLLNEKIIEEKINEHYIALGLSPTPLKKAESFRDARAARAARAAWDARAARAARDAWDARDARAARAAWDAWDARAARDARDAWDAWDAWDARTARDARAARNAWAAWDARAARNARDAWDASWIAYLCYLDSQPDLKIFMPILEALENGLWCYWYLDNCFLWLPQPKIETKNGKLHSETKAAFELPAQKIYFWNNIIVPEKLILTPETITKEDILNEKNSEVSRAIAEKLGWDEYLQRADAKLIHKWFDTNTSCHYELYDFKNRFELMPKLLKMESPELKDGTRPYYIEAVPPEFTTCEGARKWQFAKVDGTWPTIKECIDNPELTFGIET